MNSTPHKQYQANTIFLQQKLLVSLLLLLLYCCCPCITAVPASLLSLHHCCPPPAVSMLIKRWRCSLSAHQKRAQTAEAHADEGDIFLYPVDNRISR